MSKSRFIKMEPIIMIFVIIVAITQSILNELISSHLKLKDIKLFILYSIVTLLIHS